LAETAKPQSFTDVVLLRTGLRHDVDHGSRAKARAKSKKIGEAFSRYGGAPSPAGLDPSRFSVVQANLLAALNHDLSAITV